MPAHCMELSKKNESLNKNIDYKDKEKILIDDCNNQVKKFLEEYEKSDNFTPRDMDNMLGVLSYITNGSENSVEYIHQAKDKGMNGFFQYALEKTDLPIVEWLIKKGNIKYHSAKECTDFIEFCTKRLLPNEDITKRDNAYAILKVVIEHYKTEIVFDTCKDSYLQKMIILQLKHRKLETKFTIEEELLTSFIQQGQVGNSSGLADLYQTIVDVDDEDNNTLAHIIVEQHDADELHILINKNYISKKAQNKAGKTVKRLAFDNFRVFTQDPTLKSVKQEQSQAAHCCYRMLHKYFAGNNKFNKRNNCCDKHPILKRYMVNIVQGKSELLESTSSSGSSSDSSISIEKVSQPGLKETTSEVVSLVEKTQDTSSAVKNSKAVLSTLSDDPQSDRCCGWLLDYFKEKVD